MVSLILSLRPVLRQDYSDPEATENQQLQKETFLGLP